MKSLHIRSAVEQILLSKSEIQHVPRIALVQNKKADGSCKNAYHRKYHSEGRRNDRVLKLTVHGTKQESGNEKKTK